MAYVHYSSCGPYMLAAPSLFHKWNSCSVGAELEMQVLIQKELPTKFAWYISLSNLFDPGIGMYQQKWWKCSITPRIMSSATRPFLQVGGVGRRLVNDILSKFMSASASFAITYTPYDTLLKKKHWSGPWLEARWVCLATLCGPYPMDENLNLHIIILLLQLWDWSRESNMAT